MIRKLCVILILVLISVDAFADSASNIITGEVSYCGQSGVEGMMIYIPGRQYVVITGKDGKFLFEGLALGEYTINYAIDGKTIHTSTAVKVFSGNPVNLGKIRMCSSAQATTTSETIPDNRQCTGNEAVDKFNTRKVSHGLAVCIEGKMSITSCDKGYSDCDLQLDNGCEINIHNDDDNCGACDNQCASSEICALGVC